MKSGAFWLKIAQKFKGVDLNSSILADVICLIDFSVEAFYLLIIMQKTSCYFPIVIVATIFIFQVDEYVLWSQS